MQKRTLQIMAGVVATLTGIAAASGQSYSPVQINPANYTVDFVVENTYYQGAPQSVTATVGGGVGKGDRTFFERGTIMAPYNVTNGLPAPGTTITAFDNSSLQYKFPPSYVTNNTFMVDGSVSSSIIYLSSPTTCTNIAILGTGGGGSITLTYYVTHADFSQETGTISFGDWFNGTPYSLNVSGRSPINGGPDNLGAENPRLYSRFITVTNASPVTDITLFYSSGSGHACIYAVSGNSTGTWTPIDVEGHNHDTVIEKSPVALPVTATMDRGTNLVGTLGQYTWFERGYSGYTTNGLPAAGSLLTNVSSPTHVFQLPPSWTANNAILIDTNNQTANITPLVPTNYSAFALLTAGGTIGGGNTMTNTIIMQHANGVNETNLFFGYDWFNTSIPPAFIANGRVEMRARGIQNLADSTPQPRLFESTFGLSETVSPVTNIIVKYNTAPSATATTYILAVSATAGAVGPAIGSQTPSPVKVYQGSNVTMQATLTAGSAPLTYIWKDSLGSTLVNGGNISGATTSTLLISGADFANTNTYTLIVTNSVGAVTSAPISLIVYSTNLDVTLPTDTITRYNGSDPFGNEMVDKALDNTTSKYLNSFTTLPVGFVVTPSQGKSVIKGLRFYTANDASDRDPADYFLEGSTNGVDFEYISYELITLSNDRNAGGLAVDPLARVVTEVLLPNNTNVYSTYRVSFSSTKGSASLLQIGEVELLGTLVGTAPSIVVDVTPTNATAYVGLTTTLSVTGGGTPPLFYQWNHNGSPVPNATNSSYSFATLAGANNYSCTVSNATAPVANSSTATITGIPFSSGTTFAANFHNAANNAGGPGTNLVYVGQGAYSDGTNNTWNGWFGNTGFTAPSISSAGVLLPISLTLTNVAGNNGGLDGFVVDGTNSFQGMPGFIMARCALRNGGVPAGIILSNVPPGSYNMYLYGANYDNDRGAIFKFNGITKACTNNYNVNGQNPGTNFTENLNYVVYQGLSPSNGVISGTWEQISNPITGMSGEGNFNAVQLIKVPSAVTLTIEKSGANAIISWSPVIGQLQAATALTGTFTNVVGATSPYTNAASASQTYFRVQVQ